jgi:hypothetical protein
MKKTMDEERGYVELEKVLNAVSKVGYLGGHYNQCYMTLDGPMYSVNAYIALITSTTCNDIHDVIWKFRQCFIQIPPEFRMCKENDFFPIIEAEKDKIHFMIHALDYKKMTKLRYRNCRRICVILLAIAPFQQKDLRQYWVRHIVFPTWENKAWENAED